MNFQHDAPLWRRFHQLSARAVWARDIQATSLPHAALEPWFEQARERLKQAGGTEGQLPSIQAWRRVFSDLGHRPTQCRCAAESLLRRLRQHGDLPRIHPLVDLLNALSVAHALPVAVFDLSCVHGDLPVRLATGAKCFTPFAGEEEAPEPGEVVFVDGSSHAHARRWCHRQCARSAVQASTAEVLIVAEATHATAAPDVRAWLADVTRHLADGVSAVTAHCLLNADAPKFSFADR